MGQQRECGPFETIETTYHHSEKVISEAIFANMVSPRLAVLVEGGLKRQRHSIQQFIKN
jgi:hypothetical protein